MANAFDRFDSAVAETAVPSNPFDAFDSEPVNTPVAGLQSVQPAQEEVPALNMVRGAVERGGQLLGGLFTAGNAAAEKADESYPLGGLVWEGGLLPDYKGPEEYAKWRSEQGGQEPLKTAANYWNNTDVGYEENHTWERVKQEFSEGGALSGSAWAEVMAYGAEQGVKSIPDMVAAVAALPAYITARSGEIGTERAKNKGKSETELVDVLEAAPAAIGSALLERIGAKGISEAGAEALGKEALKAGIGKMVREGAKAGGKEAATEFMQEGIIEYLGERLGTGADLSLAEAVDRGAAGAVAGGVYGTGAGTAGAAYNAARNRSQAQSDQVDSAPPILQDQIDQEAAQPQPTDDNAPVQDYEGRPEWANDRTNIFRDGVEPEPVAAPEPTAEAAPAGNPFDAFDEAPVQPEAQPQPGPATETPAETGQAAEARKQLESAKSASAEPAAEQSEAPDLTESGTGVFRVPVDRINVDPQQYQFRSRVNDQGVDKRLDGVKQWDDKRAGNVLLHRREDGSLFVADGHHRVDLARRLGQTEMNARIVSEADGIDVATARVEAAMNNIADGKAEPLDVAKVFRDSGTPIPDVRGMFNLPNNQITRDGEALANLSDNVFGMVSSGQMTEKNGAAIGAAFTEAGQQEAAADAFQKVQPETEYQRQLLVNEIRAAEFAQSQGDQGGLFGDDPQEISLMQDRLKVLDALRQRLNSDKRLFKSLNDNADRAGEAGNRIATEANEKITERSARSLDLISRVTTTPALNEMVNRAARRVYDGENRAQVVKDLKQELMSYEQGKSAEGGGRPATAPRVREDAERRQEPGTGQRVPEQDPAGTGPQGQPESDQQPEVTPSLELESQTEPQLAERARARQQAEQAEADQRRSEEQRAAADDQVDGFTLTGSDRTADVAMAAGQQDLLSQAAAETETNPTDAQKEAGNYKKGKVRIQGLEIAIENPKGSTRSGTDPNGNRWESTMAHHYGDIKGTTAADGDNLDVFIGPDPDIDQVFVIDQPNADGSFDEHKVMLGFKNEKAAREGYLANYEKGWTVGPITRMSMDEFKTWMREGDTTKPVKREEARPAKKAEPAAAAPTQPIEDFGEKIEGARKDYASKLKDAKERDVSTVPLSKSWPEPNYQKMLDEGVPAETVALVRALRDEVPTKPQKGWKLKGWVEMVTGLRDMASTLMENQDVASKVLEQIRAMKASNRTAREAKHILGRMDLYQEMGHENSFKGVTFEESFYQMYMGENNVTLWEVERLSKASAFGNMPRTLATGKTREEALTNLRKALGKLPESTKTGKAVRFNIYRDRYSNDVFIGKKIGKDVVRMKSFDDDIKAARKYLEENQQALEEQLEKMKRIPPHRRTSNSPRVGVDHRKGGDVTPEAFSETFGFRGVQFGNYVEQGRRQADLNEAYDALMDLAGILDIPAKALSLNGELGLAFGARGKGGKNAPMAHYEPGTIVINLTKKTGAGSLAHEWWHSLDNYFGRGSDRKPKDAFATGGQPASDVRPEMVDAFRNIRQTVNRIGMKERSRKLDKMRTKVYWSTDIEMSARAFESYVIERLKDQNASNDYLANIVSEDYWKASEALGMQDSDSYPYPEAAEIPDIRAAYDHFIQTIESRETEEGGVALFSRDGEYRMSPGFQMESLSIQEAESIRDELMQDWKGAPDVIIRNSISEFPPALQRAIAEAGAQGDMRGVLWRDNVYLLASRIPDRARMEQVILHEVIGHYGLRKMLGKDMERVLNQIWISHGGKGRAKYIIDRYFPDGFDVNNKEHRHIVAEELIAHLAEQNRGQTLVQRAVAIIREGLRKLGFTLEFTVDDIVDLLRRSRQTVENGGFEIDTRIEGAAVAASKYSKPSEPDINFSRNDQANAEAFRAIPIITETVNGREFRRLPVKVIQDPELASRFETKIFILPGGLVEFRTRAPDIYTQAEMRDKILEKIDGMMPKENWFWRLTNNKSEALLAKQGKLRASKNHAEGRAEPGLSVADHLGYSIIGYDYAYKVDGEVIGTGSDGEPILSIESLSVKSKVMPIEQVVNEDRKRRAKFLENMGWSVDHYAALNGSIQKKAPDEFDAMFEVGDIASAGKDSSPSSGLNRSDGSANGGSSIETADRSGEGVDAPRAEGGRGSTDDVPPPGARFSRADVPDLDPEPFGAPSDTFIRKAVSKIADKFTVLKGVQQNIKERFGEIAEDADAYMAEELFHGKVENDIRLIQENMVEPLAKKMSEYGISLKQLDEFLYAMHAPERNRVIAERNPKMPDGGSGMTNAEAAAVINKAEQSGKLGQYKELAGRVHKMLERRRQILSEAGLLDEDTLGAWEASYKHYVPLKGWAADEKQDATPRSGKGFSISGKESQLAAGRRSKAASPVAFAISDLSEAVLRHRKNEVGNAFLNLVQAYPNDNYWRVYTDENPEVQRKVVRRKDPATGKMVTRVEEQVVPMAMMTDRYFTTKVDGETRYIKIEDERLMNAMRNLGPDNNGILVRALGTVTRLMSSLNTSYNPEFVISNFSRDIQTALLNLTSEQSSEDGKARGKKIAAKTLKDVPTSIRAINASLKGSTLTGKAGEWQKHFDQFRADGAKTGWFDMKDVDGQMKDLETMISMASGGAGNTARRTFKAVTDWVENTNSAIENGVRLSAYVNAIEAGIPRAQAASLAKNMTVNFNRRGELGTTMNALYMFANASVQGTANFVRTLGRLNGQKGDRVWRRLNTAQKIAVGMAVGGFALSVLNRLVAGDDDDGVNWWDKVPDYVKERNIVIMKSLVGGEPGEYWTIPLPYGYNIFPVIGTSMEHMLASDKSAGDIAGNVVLAALGSFSPIGFEESQEAYGVVAKNITPTILRPIASISLNENFMGGPIYKENFPFGTQKPDSALYFRSTPEMFKKLAKGLNDATGGSEFRSGAVDLSPDVMQFLVGYYGGGAYDFFTSRAPNAALKFAQGIELEDREIPFWRKVHGKVLPYEDQSTFYDRRNEINQLVSERDNLKGRERVEFVKEYRDKIRLQNTVKSVEKRLKALRKQRDQIEVMGLSAAEEDERLQHVERQMKRAIDQFNKRYNEAED